MRHTFTDIKDIAECAADPKRRLLCGMVESLANNVSTDPWACVPHINPHDLRDGHYGEEVKSPAEEKREPDAPEQEDRTGPEPKGVVPRTERHLCVALIHLARAVNEGKPGRGTITREPGEDGTETISVRLHGALVPTDDEIPHNIRTAMMAIASEMFGRKAGPGVITCARGAPGEISFTHHPACTKIQGLDSTAIILDELAPQEPDGDDIPWGARWRHEKAVESSWTTIERRSGGFVFMNGHGLVGVRELHTKWLYQKEGDKAWRRLGFPSA